MFARSSCGDLCPAGCGRTLPTVVGSRSDLARIPQQHSVLVIHDSTPTKSPRVMCLYIPRMSRTSLRFTALARSLSGLYRCPHLPLIVLPYTLLGSLPRSCIAAFLERLAKQSPFFDSCVHSPSRFRTLAPFRDAPTTWRDSRCLLSPDSFSYRPGRRVMLVKNFRVYPVGPSGATSFFPLSRSRPL